MDYHIENPDYIIKRKKADVMTVLKKFSLLLLLIISSAVTFGQNDKEVMADTMRSNGRIYVVIAVVVTILIGLLLYLFRLDRKISRLEKDK
jgi:uncharacterized membrane protein